MKALMITFCLAFLGAQSHAANIITTQSDAVPTCYEQSNTAIFTAIKNAEAKAKRSCRAPVLLQLKTEIKPGNCGYVRVAAQYNCQ